MQNHEIIFPHLLDVTAQAIDLSGLTQGQKDFYLRLFFEVAEIYHAASKPRVVIGIAGASGAGKSVVAVLLQNLAKQAGAPFAVESITIDAYHFPNEFLLSHVSEGKPLKQVKGRFDTYDAKALARDLTAFSAGETVSFPIYSRKLHDPVQGGVTLKAREALLIIEGQWLLFDQAGWAEVGPRLDYTIFIDSDPEKARGPVLKRHMAGGRSLEDAARHYELVDASNAALVRTTKPKASKVIPPYYSLP
jgi:pantothenate kinase